SLPSSACAAHRYLHSFPTRRSSDLEDYSSAMSPFRNNIILRTTVYYVVLFGVAAALYKLPQAQAVMHASLDALTSSGSFAGLGRSEEHTSELQSLRHLVCRLLLEKK